MYLKNDENCFFVFKNLAPDFDFKPNCFPLLYVKRVYINQNFLNGTKFNLAVKFLSCEFHNLPKKEFGII